MKKIAIITATRAEYGLLSPLIKELRKYESQYLVIHLIVTGTHLSENYGMTKNEIDDRIDYEIPISVRSNSEIDISSNQSDALLRFTKLFVTERYSAVLLLGDRYETLAIAIAAGNTKTPVFHLFGGDTTEGAIDEWIRHSITKISYIHFVSNEYSRRRVIQLGEFPDRVFNYGSTSIDNITNMTRISKEDALCNIGVSNCRYVLCTYHPVTLKKDNINEQIEELLKAINKFQDMQFIVTKANSDQGGARINELLNAAVGDIKNMHVFSSLGMQKYLSLMQHAELVLGNSSSGILEAPVFRVPTVNIGDRQRGRLQAKSIINCGIKSENIIDAIKQSLSEDHKRICRSVLSPYGDGHASERIAKKTIEIVCSNRIDLMKRFYDLRFEYEEELR